MSGIQEKLAALLAKAKEEKQKKQESDLKQLLETVQDASIVDLSFSKVSLLGIKALLPILKQNPFLTTLNLSGNLLNDTVAEDLAAVLESSESLISLDLSGNVFSEAGIKILLTALRKKKLAHLSFNQAELGDRSVIALATILDFSALVFLELRQNSIGDEAIKALSVLLPRETPLATLDLRNNHITHLGVQIFSEALGKNSSLTALFLSNNWIGREAFPALLGIFYQNTTLTTLALECNYLLAEQQAALEAELQRNRRQVDQVVMAIRSGQEATLKSLIESKASVASLQSWGEKSGYTPLMVAAQSNQLASVKVLLQKRHPGFWRQNEAPLTVCVEKKKEDVTERNGRTALEMAEASKHGEIARLIWREMSKYYPSLRKKEIDLAKRLGALTSAGLPSVLGHLVLEYVYQEQPSLRQSIALGNLYL